MADLETLISEAAKTGRLTALTLWPSSKGWQANAKNHLGGWNCIAGADPVAALRAALTGPFTTPGAPTGRAGSPAATPAERSVFD